jgi:hypothetical protein
VAIAQADQPSLTVGIAKRAWIGELPPLCVMAVYGLAVHLIAAEIGQSGRIVWTLYLPYAAPVMLAFACAGLAMLSLIGLRRSPGIPMGAALRYELERRGTGLTAIVLSLPMLLSLPLFLSLFSSFKALIPMLRPFTWDATLAELDRAMHGGIDPWRFLQPILDYPLLVRALDFLYHPVWSLGLFAIWAWQAIDRHRPELRLQLLLAIPTAWIALGSIGGVVFSSAGPCYFAQLGGGPDRFGPLLTRLAEIDSHWPLVSHIAQSALWDLYRSGAIGFGSGISAMPSVHVATAFIAVLLARRYGPVPFSLSLLMFLAIALSSVLLGWHYAIDAYAGVLLVSPIWLACGAVARKILRARTGPTPVKQAHDAAVGGFGGARTSP